MNANDRYVQLQQRLKTVEMLISSQKQAIQETLDTAKREGNLDVALGCVSKLEGIESVQFLYDTAVNSNDDLQEANLKFIKRKMKGSGS